MDGLSLPMLLVLSGGHEFRKSIATSQECQRVVSFIIRRRQESKATEL